MAGLLHFVARPWTVSTDSVHARVSDRRSERRCHGVGAAATSVMWQMWHVLSVVVVVVVRVFFVCFVLFLGFVVGAWFVCLAC